MAKHRAGDRRIMSISIPEDLAKKLDRKVGKGRADGRSATIARLSRSAMLDVMTQDYIRTARSKGVGEASVVLKHGMRNAAIPIVTVVGNSFGYLLVGAVLTETVFALPGLGREVVEAIKMRDRELITGGILLMSFVFIGVNLLVDLSYAWFDPRIRDDRS